MAARQRVLSASGATAMRISVVGGRGFIGQAVVQALRAGVGAGVGAEILLPDRAALAAGAPFGGWGMMVWAAGLTADFRQRPFDTVAAHVGDLSRVISRGGVEGILYFSSTRVYMRAAAANEVEALPTLPMDPSDLYNLTKLAGEALCLSAGLARVKIARLSNIIGPREATRRTFLGALCREALAGQIVLQSAPHSVKDYLWIDDAAAILAQMATDDSEGIFNVASGRQIAHLTWAQALSHHTKAALEIPDLLPETSFAPIDITRMAARYGPARHDPLNYLSTMLSV